MGEFSERIPILWNLTYFSPGVMRMEQVFDDERQLIVTRVPFPFGLGWIEAELTFSPIKSSPRSEKLEMVNCTEVIRGRVVTVAKPFVVDSIIKAHTSLLNLTAKYFNSLSEGKNVGNVQNGAITNSREHLN